MKRKSKIVLKTLMSIGIVSLISVSSFIAFRPKEIEPLDVYILNFNTEDKGSDKIKNEYINKMISDTRIILDKYSDYYFETYGEKFPGLTFDFTNLNSQQSQGEKNFFILLDQTLKGIDPRLGFNNIARTPSSVQDGFFQKNTEMMSFYWSPDFNSVATWLAYVFSDEYSVPNLWPSLYSILNKGTDPKYPWITDLKNELISKKLYLSPIEALNKGLDKKVIKASAEPDTVTGFYTSLANAIGLWISAHSTLPEITHDPLEKPEEHHLNDKVIGKAGLGIELMNWMTSQVTNIPFVEDGPTTKTLSLIRQGYFNPTNPNAEINYRDWFWNASTAPSQNNSKFRWWAPADPFITNKTPFNPAFSNAASATTFQSAWSGLTSWTIIDEDLNPKEVNSEIVELVTTGSKNPIDSLKIVDNKMTFKIRPIPWVDSKGNNIINNGKKTFLSPEDFRASIIGFVRSNQIRLNSNAYFFDLIKLDVNKTINDPKNLLRNENTTDEKEFVMYFNNPEISETDVLDVLQKQYFSAIPAFKESVQKIVDKDKFINAIGAKETTQKDKWIEGEFALEYDSNSINFDQFYGCGDWNKNWLDYAYAAPYYVENITTQKIDFELNPSYFAAFSKEELKKPEYKSFNLEYDAENETTGKIEKIKKINTVTMNYAGSYSDIITFEQFKNNELDLSSVSSANMQNVIKSFPNDARYSIIQKINKSNVMGFNLQIYAKHSTSHEDDNVLLDSNNKPMQKEIIAADGTKKKVVTYSVDKFGNYDFQGQTPKVKSKISNSYKDLIVRDFYTPIEEKGTSATIRETIVNTINWVSLKSVVFPGISKSVQYSFLPYGVYDIGENPHMKKYWWYISYKPYMTNVQLAQGLSVENYNMRKSGLMIWTYDELRLNTIKGEK